MKDHLETDLKTIASLAEPHWADNWNFRAFLQQEVDPVRLDTVVHEVNKDVSARIDCTTCGNCCREVYPHFDPPDVTRLAKGLAISEEELKKLMRPEDDGTLAFCQRPCPLLADNKCSAYAHRPADCRLYPHLDQEDFLGLSIGIIENYGTCPIIFNVYGRLKTMFPYDPARDYIGDTDPLQT